MILDRKLDPYQVSVRGNVCKACGYLACYFRKGKPVKNDLTDQEKDAGIQALVDVFPEVDIHGTIDALLVIGYLVIHQSNNKYISSPPAYEISELGQHYIQPSENLNGVISIDGLLITPVVKPGMLRELREKILSHEAAKAAIDDRIIFNRKTLVNKEESEDNISNKYIKNTNVSNKDIEDIEDIEPEKQNYESGPPSSHVLFYWLAIPLSIPLIGVLENEYGAESAIKIIGALGLVWILWPIWMGSGSDTLSRINGFARGAAFIFLLLLGGLILGFILPSSCSSSSNQSPTEIYFRR